MENQNVKTDTQRREPAVPPPPAGSRIVHRREVLPVPIRRLLEIAAELKREQGRDVTMKQEGHELVFFSEIDKDERERNEH